MTYATATTAADPEPCLHLIERSDGKLRVEGYLSGSRAQHEVLRQAGPATHWSGNGQAREMRHSFVSLMSEAGVPLEAFARVVGHSSTKVTELVYRKQLRPVLTEGTAVMETLFELPATDQKRSPDGG